MRGDLRHSLIVEVILATLVVTAKGGDLASVDCALDPAAETRGLHWDDAAYCDAIVPEACMAAPGPKRMYAEFFSAASVGRRARTSPVQITV
jgi:hypothetical protein